jgi:hypothetical protein
MTMRRSIPKEAERFAPLAALLLMVPCYGVEVTRMVTEPGSKVTIDGSNHTHRRRIEGEIIRGWIEVGEGFPLAADQKVTPGAVQAHIEASIPVRSLHGSEGTDALTHRKLKIQSEPEIVFRCDDLTLTAKTTDKNTPYKLTARGELIVARVTNKISLQLSVLPLNGNRIKIATSTSVKMNDFGIDPSICGDFDPPQGMLCCLNGTQVGLPSAWRQLVNRVTVLPIVDDRALRPMSL